MEKKANKQKKTVHNFLNSAIVNQMQHTREHAVVTKDRDNTIIHDEIAVNAKELNSKFLTRKVEFTTMVINKIPKARLKRSFYFLIQHCASYDNKHGFILLILSLNQPDDMFVICMFDVHFGYV